MTVKIAPSLAAAPLDRLGDVVFELDQAGVDYIHIDVEDGSFTPVMTLGTKIISDLRPYTNLPFDVHLMMQNPEWILPALVDYGADRIAVHLEACPYPRRSLGLIHRLGAVPGIALNPVTPLSDLSYLAPFLQFVILLTTEPEDGQMPFIPEILEKLRTGKQHPRLESLEWVIDGGVNLNNLAEIAEAGADTVVVGRSTFRDGDIQGNIRQMKNLIQQVRP